MAADGPSALTVKEGQPRQRRARLAYEQRGNRRGKLSDMPDDIRTAVDRMEPALWLGRRVARFGALTQHPLWPEMYGQLVTGTSGAKIAAFVQSAVPPDDPLGRQNISPSALTRRLYRFRKLLPEEVMIARTTLDDRYRRAHATLDVLDEFDALIRYQKNRISKFATREESLPLPLEQMRREVATLSALLMDRNQAALALGVGAPVPTVVGQQFIGGQHLTLNANRPTDAVREFVRAEPNKTAGVLELLDALDRAEDEEADGDSTAEG